MLYTINLDKDNLVLSLAHTKNDNVELDLTDVDLDFLNAYQYFGSGLVLNQERKEEIIAEREKEEKTPTWDEIIEAQVTYTALMTDTLLEEEE